MPALSTKTGDAVSIAIDQAGALETIAVWHLRAGRYERAATAVGRARAQLRWAEVELWARAGQTKASGRGRRRRGGTP